MKQADFISMVNSLVATFGQLPSFASETEVRANVEKILYTHGVGINVGDQFPNPQSVVDTCDHVIKAAARAGIAGDELRTRKENVMDVADRMCDMILELRKNVDLSKISVTSRRLKPLNAVAGLDDAYSSLRRVLDAAYDQAATGKGAERHANARSFESQPMQSISDLLGDNHGLLFQAVKKIQESTRMPHYRLRERELLGAINYIAGAIIYDLNHSAPEEDSDQHD